MRILAVLVIILFAGQLSTAQSSLNSVSTTIYTYEKAETDSYHASFLQNATINISKRFEVNVKPFLMEHSFL